MRPALQFFFISILIISCNQDKKYKLSITTRGEALLGGTEEKTKDENINASNDSVAFYKAVESYMISLKVSEEMKKYKYNTVPVSFKLIDDKGADVSLKLTKGFIDSAFAYERKLVFSVSSSVASASTTVPTAKDSFTTAQEKIAFGNLRFGMTEKEVDKLTKSYQEKIGGYEYWFSPLFDHQKRLYKIEFRTSPRDANYIDTYVKSSLDNLYETIKNKYGEGEYVQSFPSILEFQSGYVRYTHRWNIGDKEIVVGAGEVEGGSEYYSFCWIFSKSMNETEDNYQKNNSDSVKNKDASKF